MALHCVRFVVVFTAAAVDVVVVVVVEWQTISVTHNAFSY